MTIKVKHLVTALLLIGAFLALLQYIVIPKLQVYYAENNFVKGNVEGKKSILAAINESTSSSRWELIRKYMIEHGTDSPAFDVYVGPGSTYSTQAIPESTSWSWEEKLPYLEAYLAEGPPDESMIRAAKQLAYYYGSEGKVNEALAALETAGNRLRDDRGNQQIQLKLERAKLYANNDHTEKAELLLTELDNQRRSEDIDFYGEVAQLRAQMMIRSGNVDNALEEVTRELEALKKTVAEQKKKFPDMGDFTPVALEQLTSLQTQLKQALEVQGKGSSIVSGTIKRSNGLPMTRVGVYLRREVDVYHSVAEGEPYQMLTDANGRYEFKGVLPGSYQLYIGLMFDQIDGWTWPITNNDWIEVKPGQSLMEDIVLRPLIEIKSPVNQQVITGETLDFRWEPIEGAAYYQLSGTLPMENGSGSIVLFSDIKNNQIELPIEELYDQPTGIAYKSVEDKQIVDGSALLGFANPDKRYGWSVEAFDKSGRPISKSGGYRLNDESLGSLPFFYLKNRTLTEADRLLISDKLDAALAAYKTAYKSDNQDRHSLRMIIRIYEAQISGSKTQSLAHEAVPYLERMLEFSQSRTYLFQLFAYYSDKQDWSKVDDYYGLLAEQWRDKPESFTQSFYGTALMKQRRFVEAAALFKEAMKGDPSHRFIGNYLATELYTTGRFDLALKLAEDFPERTPYEQGIPNWSKLVQELEQESKTNGSSYAKDIKMRLESYFDGDQERLDSWMSTTRQKALKAFILALLKVG